MSSIKEIQFNKLCAHFHAHFMRMICANCIARSVLERGDIAIREKKCMSVMDYIKIHKQNCLIARKLSN